MASSVCLTSSAIHATSEAITIRQAPSRNAAVEPSVKTWAPAIFSIASSCCGDSPAPSDVAVADYDALVLPGGVANPDALRTDAEAVAFIRDFVGSGKPVAAICHAAWTLVEADVVRGRRVTSWPSLRTDIVNAGGDWVDDDLVLDGNLITSRKPDDLPAFTKALVSALG